MTWTVDTKADALLQDRKMTPVDRTAPLFDPVERRSNLVVFGFDSAEVSQIRRILSLIALGHEVMAFTMRRGKGPVETNFPNVHLCFSTHEKLGQRIFQVAASVIKTLRHGNRLKQADLILARNLDMLAIAWAARLLTGNRKTPLVYECLDIHRAMVGSGFKARVLRWAESRLLAKCNMLAVSSSAYLDHYFKPYQGYDGPVALWENKVIPTLELTPRPDTADPASDRPIRLGWVGAIRCLPSFELLTETANALRDRIEIHIHGIVHHHAIPDFETVVANHANIFYHGPYAYPRDLVKVYDGIDVVWNIDLWLRGGNSDWALSNRIYEAGFCGCPSIALEGTAIADQVQRNQLGWILVEPTVEAVADLLETLTPTDLRRASQLVLDQPTSKFVSDGTELQAVIDSLT